MNKTQATESISISNWSSIEIGYQEQRNSMLEKLTSAEVIGAPFVYSDRQMLTTSLTRIHLFEKILSTQGAIVECGVHKANSLFLYYHLSTQFQQSTRLAVTRRAAELLQAKVNALTLLIFAMRGQL